MKGWLIAVLGILGIAVVLLLVDLVRTPVQPVTPPPATSPPSATLLTPPPHVPPLAEELAREDSSIWRMEVLAQEYEQTFIDLWDGMRARMDDQHVLLAQFPFDHLHVRRFGPPESHAWGVMRACSTGEGTTVDGTGWRDLIQTFVTQGEVLEQSEWHHQAFEQLPDGTYHSRIRMRLFLNNTHLHRRSVVSGTLGVRWSPSRDARGRHVVADIDATNLEVVYRKGDTPFQEAVHVAPADLGIDARAAMDPVLAVDLDGDGKDDLVLPSMNLWLRNTSHPGHIAFEARPLFAQPLSLDTAHAGPDITAAVAADFTGHGLVDLLVCGQDLPPHLYVMTPDRRFTREPIPLMRVPPGSFAYPVTMAAGDLTGDGRLDVWIGQYRRPYLQGNLPKPYFDANDGFPAHLLINQDGYHFVDTTAASGLAEKRYRRTYSSALLDLDGDGHLDLVTVNDFAGVDAYRGDGHGHFTDVTSTLVDERSSFGMSLAVADFLNRGLLDLFVSGMGSTTARRLEQMKLGRQDKPLCDRMRMKMGYGNRLLLGQPSGVYRQAPFNDTIARTGWSWGCAACDLDNDGHMDLYVADGNMSRATAKDYCTRFWTHDVYRGGPPTPAFSAYLADQAPSTRGMSWNPFEHKALLMNEGDGRFLDVAYLMGLGFEYDGREVLAFDVDGDGKVDLIEVELQPPQTSPGFTRPVLHVYHNAMPAAHHWIQVRLGGDRQHTVMGATITVQTALRRTKAVIVSGDGYRTQQPPVVHVGLGEETAIEHIDIHWPEGQEQRLSHPGIDQEISVRPSVAR